MSLADKQKALLRRYVDLAYVEDDLIMRSTATATAASGAALDWVTFGLFSPIKTAVQAPTMAAVRVHRRNQAQKLYGSIKALGAQQVATVVNALHSKLGANQTPNMELLDQCIPATASGAGGNAALVQAASGAGAAAASVASAAAMDVADVFVDVIGDAATDALAEAIPFAGGAVGAAKSGTQVGLLIKKRDDLHKEIASLRQQGAAPK
jgi:hypothetical protein